MTLTVATVPAITGTTDVYLILGDPVEQVRAPESFNRIFALMGIDAVLVPARVAPADLSAFVRNTFLAPNIKGMWVTMPHKSAVMEVLQHCSDTARLAGAVNAIRRNADGSLEGALFDGEGFVAGLRYAAIEYVGKRVLILGAGGAAAAIASALLVAPGGPVGEIALFDPAPGMAHALAARMAQAGRSRVRAVENNDVSGFDLVVNASPLGLKATDPLPCDVTRLAPHAVLADILMKNQPTPLLLAARARGLRAQAGFEMLIQQSPLYLDFFGFSEAATALREDADFIRRQIYPAELHADIRRQQAAPLSTREAPASVI